MANKIKTITIDKLPTHFKPLFQKPNTCLPPQGIPAGHEPVKNAKKGR